MAEGNLLGVIDKLDKGLDHLYAFSKEARAFVSAKYDYLKREDRLINLVIHILFVSRVFYQIPLLTFPLIFVGFLMGSCRKSVKETANKILETKTLESALFFAACIILHRNFWHSAALGYGIFLSLEGCTKEEKKAEDRSQHPEEPKKPG